MVHQVVPDLHEYISSVDILRNFLMVDYKSQWLQATVLLQTFLFKMFCFCVHKDLEQHESE